MEKILSTPFGNPDAGVLHFAAPTYSGGRYNTQAVVSACTNPAPFRGVAFDENAHSALALNFNAMWCRALNARDRGVTHFLMLHNDVIPHEPGFVGQMANIMEQTGASVLSVVLPIKDTRGLTSTAFDTGDVFSPRRITMSELASMPSTFTHPSLLVNTGLMLVDLRGPWVEEIYFTINDRITRAPDGQFCAQMEPEDWFFSRKAHQLGARVFATREVRASHFGGRDYDNTGTWGTVLHDGGDPLPIGAPSGVLAVPARP